MMDLFYESKQRPADTIKQSRSQRLAKAANPDKGIKLLHLNHWKI